MRLKLTATQGVLALGFLLTLFVAPASAGPPPSAQEDGVGHFIGCFSLLLDSVMHAKYCGPSLVPADPSSLVEGMSSDSPPPPPPTCFPCAPNAVLPLMASPYQVAALAYDPAPAIYRPRKPVVLMACCPGGSS